MNALPYPEFLRSIHNDVGPVWTYSFSAKVMHEQLTSTFDMLVSKLVAKSWADRDFLSRFATDPKTVLREADVVFDETIRVVVNSPDCILESNAAEQSGLLIFLCSKPDTLSDESIKAWAEETGNQMVFPCYRFCS